MILEIYQKVEYRQKNYWSALGRSMDKINKTLLKVPIRQRRRIMKAVEKIANDQLSGLDVRKIKNTNNTYRARIGDYRIIFSKRRAGNIINVIAKRDEKTYKKY